MARFRGGVAGAEPPHKGGPTRPDRPELQWSVVSYWSQRFQYLGVSRELAGASSLKEVCE